MADQQKVACGLSNGAIFNDLERPLTWFSRSRHFLHFIFHKQLQIRPQLLQKANRKPHPSFRMAPVSMILSDLQTRFQGHSIIQRQISLTRKWYKIQLQLQWRTNKVIHGVSNRAILNDLEGPQTQISRSGHSLTPNISPNGCRYGHSYCVRRIGNRTQAFKLFCDWID